MKIDTRKLPYRLDTRKLPYRLDTKDSAFQIGSLDQLTAFQLLRKLYASQIYTSNTFTVKYIFINALQQYHAYLFNFQFHY